MKYDKISWNDYSSEWWVEYLDYQPYKCSDCKFANEYLLDYWFPYFEPTCSKGHSIHHNKHACKDFELCSDLWRKDRRRLYE